MVLLQKFSELLNVGAFFLLKNLFCRKEDFVTEPNRVTVRSDRDTTLLVIVKNLQQEHAVGSH
jgi:hypothetical protein